MRRMDVTDVSEICDDYSYSSNMNGGKWIDKSGTVGTMKSVNGKTMKMSIASAKCSECGLCVQQVSSFMPFIEFPFCPHCGERMIK